MKYLITGFTGSRNPIVVPLGDVYLFEDKDGKLVFTETPMVVKDEFLRKLANYVENKQLNKEIKILSYEGSEPFETFEDSEKVERAHRIVEDDFNTYARIKLGELTSDQLDVAYDLSNCFLTLKEYNNMLASTMPIELSIISDAFRKCLSHFGEKYDEELFNKLIKKMFYDYNPAISVNDFIDRFTAFKNELVKEQSELN